MPSAATKIRSKFNRQGSGNYAGLRDYLTSDENGSAEPDESTTLLQRITTTDSGTPFREHRNPLIRYPFLTLSITWKILMTNYVNVLLVFVPLGIVAGAIGWNPNVVF